MKARFCDVPEGGKFKAFSRDFVREGVAGIEHGSGRCFIFRTNDIVTLEDPPACADPSKDQGFWAIPSGVSASCSVSVDTELPKGFKDYFGVSAFGGILSPSGEDEDEAIQEYIDYQLRIK